MREILYIGLKFYQKNGFLGICWKKIGDLRGGAGNNPKIPHSQLIYKNKSSSLTASLKQDQVKEQIEEILNNDQISEKEKKVFRDIREDPIFDDSESLKRQRLINCLIEKAKHPVYTKIKGKIPYIILCPFTFAELTRLAAHRVLGFTSAPFTFPALIGFSMPCAVTFSMLEMYVPDKFKFPCKCAKWSGGIVFYGLCSSIDFLTADIETKFFGQPLPIDAPQLMGTLPERTDWEDVRKLHKLAEVIIKKSTLGEETD